MATPGDVHDQVHPSVIGQRPVDLIPQQGDPGGDEQFGGRPSGEGARCPPTQLDRFRASYIVIGHTHQCRGCREGPGKVEPYPPARILLKLSAIER
ncbi:hypothetical protein GCM10022140_56520 [Rhodococcus aetherivorans]